MINLQPVKGIGDQEIQHHGAFVIIEQRSPHGMYRCVRIRDLIKGRSVKKFQSSFCSRESSRRPVQDHADLFFMKLIDKPVKILRHPESSVHRVISVCGIGACGVVQIRRYRMKLHMSIAKFLRVGGKFPAVFPLMDICLQNSQRLFSVPVFLTVLHPGVVIPGEFLQVGHHGSAGGRTFHCRAVGIGFPFYLSALYFDLIFIKIPCLGFGHKKLENAGHRHPVHDVAPTVPFVKIAHHADAYRIGRPDHEADAFRSVYRHRMGSQLVVGVIINARAESLFLIFCDLPVKGVGICVFFCLSVFRYKEFVCGDLTSGNKSCEITRLVFLFRRICPAA